MTQIAPMLDPNQRAAPRMRTLIAARISFNNGQSALDCLIRNLSDTGAKLIVSAAATTAECFDLIVLQKSVTRRARIAWRRGEAIGVPLMTTHPGQRTAARMQGRSTEV